MKLIGIDNGINAFHTTSMKTAISIPDDLFKKVDRFARQNKYSRSKVFIMAVRAFLEKMENKKLLDDLNAAYSIEETDEERKVRELGKRHFAEIVSRENK